MESSHQDSIPTRKGLKRDGGAARNQSQEPHAGADRAHDQPPKPRLAIVPWSGPSRPDSQESSPVAPSALNQMANARRAASLKDSRSIEGTAVGFYNRAFWFRSRICFRIHRVACSWWCCPRADAKSQSAANN